MSDFRDLRVYQAAFSVALEFFDLSKAWPRDERFAPTDQIRRSSRSVCANVAEAWMKRRYPKHFTSKLSDASAEVAETLVWLEFATAHGYLNPEDAETLGERIRGVTGGLVKMMARPDQWCVREEPAEYAAAPDHVIDSLTPRLPGSQT